MYALILKKAKYILNMNPGGGIETSMVGPLVILAVLGQEENISGLLQVRCICWVKLHEEFSCHSFKPDNRDMTKLLMNNLTDILSWKFTYSW